MYPKKLMKIFEHPKNVGEIKNPDARGKVQSEVCGDIMEIYLKIKDNKITDIKFKTFGCLASVIAGSTLTDAVKGKKLSDVKKITKKEVLEKLKELPPIKFHCADLALDTLKKAIEGYERKHGKKSNKKK